MGSNSIIKLMIFISMVIFCLSVGGILIYKKVNLKNNFTGYLKRAADANSVEVAYGEIKKATKYLEDNNLTSGYTSALWKSPSEDISFFYQNLKVSEKELSEVDSSTSQIERTNTLMKLRETLLDNGEDGYSVTCPEGLSRYPNNLMWGILIWVSVIIGVIIFSWVIVIFND